jgi:DNA polymerase-3 subunit beta
VLIRATHAGVSLSATDLETSFEGQYAAVVETQGAIALNSRKLFEIVKDFPQDEIVLDGTENHWVKIGNETVEYNIAGLDPEDFPEIPKIENVDFYDIPSSVLADMISKSIVIGAANDERRNHILGVYLSLSTLAVSQVLRMVSTDGNRLCKTDFHFEESSVNPVCAGVLIPKKSLSEVEKFLDAEGNVQLAFNDNSLIVKKENEVFVVRLLEGEFPQYAEIIQKQDGSHILLNRQMFLMMLRRMSILSSEEYKGVIFNFNENVLTISSSNPEIGESKEDMPIEFDRKKITVMFNPKFFIDTLNVIGDEKIILSIINEEKPCLVEGEKDKSYISVIMPMRI